MRISVLFLKFNNKVKYTPIKKQLYCNQELNHRTEISFYKKMHTNKKSSYAAIKIFSPIKKAAMLPYGTFPQPKSFHL